MENEPLPFSLGVHIFLTCLVLHRSGGFAFNPEEAILFELAPVWSVELIEVASHP